VSLGPSLALIRRGVLMEALAALLALLSLDPALMPLALAAVALSAAAAPSAARGFSGLARGMEGAARAGRVGAALMPIPLLGMAGVAAVGLAIYRMGEALGDAALKLSGILTASIAAAPVGLALAYAALGRAAERAAAIYVHMN
jgi:hypothetical protein